MKSSAAGASSAEAVLPDHHHRRRPNRPGLPEPEGGRPQTQKRAPHARFSPTLGSQRGWLTEAAAPRGSLGTGPVVLKSVCVGGGAPFPAQGLAGGNTAGQRCNWGPPWASAALPFPRRCALVALKAWHSKETTRQWESRSSQNWFSKSTA